MLVLLEITVLRPMKAILDLPVTTNEFLERRRRNLIGIKTTHEIASLKRGRFSLAANFFINTNQCPATRNAEFLPAVGNLPVTVANKIPTHPFATGNGKDSC